MNVTQNTQRVAIIGGGPAGLVAAKSLLEEGLQPIVFEQSSNVGGQWNATAPHSGIWTSMRANTSKITTCFSDFAYEEPVHMFPTHQQIHAYLLQYADRFHLNQHIHLNSRVNRVSRADNEGWFVQSTTEGESQKDEIFSHVIVASGRYNKPQIPQVKGLERFKGSGGVSHTFDYQSNEPFKGKRVLIIGNSISGLEVASEMANEPTISVISSCRKSRYIFTKTLAGIPTDCIVLTRFATLLNRVLPPEVAAEGLKDLLLTHCGNPVQYGGIKPAENILEAGFSQCQWYLAQVAEGKILPKRGVVEVTEESVIFEDGSQEQIDAIVFATGYQINLPFLSNDILQIINADDTHIDLYRQTFHPDLPHLAFIGLYAQIGSYFPTLELQARWIAMTWSGIKPLPSQEQMRAGIREFQEWKQTHFEETLHEMAVMLSNEAGVAPDLLKHPEIAKALLFGPLAPSQFRLDGHGRREDAAQEFAVAASTFGCITSPILDEKQMAGLAMVVDAVKEDQSLASLLQLLQRETIT